MGTDIVWVNEKKIQQGFDRPWHVCACNTDMLIKCCSPELSIVKVSLHILYTAGAVNCKVHTETYIMLGNRGYKLGVILFV
jgi:hypothetical protein